MKKTTKFLLTAAGLMLCCMAQAQVANVSITGPLLDAVIENHSDQPVIAVNVAYTDASGAPWRHQKLFTANSLGIAPGASESLHTWSKHQKFNTPGAPGTITSYAVTAVIFASGELRGDERGDATGRFLAQTEASLQAMNHVWSMALSGNWDGVQNYASDDSGDSMGKFTAARLLNARSKLGSGEGAVNMLAHLGKLPLNVWKGGRARVQRAPSFLDAFAAWLAPITAHAQNPQFISVVTWPTTYYNPPHYQSMWNWSCNDSFINPSDPCPGQSGTTPFQGVAATCTQNGGYTIGVQGQVTQDSPYPISISNGSGTAGSPQYTLRQNGQCYDLYLGNLEGWAYTNYCQGSTSSSHPIMQNDNTGQYNICGIGINGYF